MPTLDAMRTVRAEPISMQKPLKTTINAVTLLCKSQSSCVRFLGRAEKSVPGWSDFGEVLAKCFDDSAAPDPQTYGDARAPVEQDPDGRGGLSRHHTRGANQPQRHQRTNRIAASKRRR